MVSAISSLSFSYVTLPCVFSLKAPELSTLRCKRGQQSASSEDFLLSTKVEHIWERLKCEREVWETDRKLCNSSLNENETERLFLGI